MKISMKSDYGVRAVVDLALHYGQGLTQSADIAARQGIPEPYLDQLLTVLRKAGIVRSTRGPKGGHVLAKLPADMTLGEVVAALEGPLSPIGCVGDVHVCPQSAECVQREVWQQVKEAMDAVLDATTIESLAKKQAARDTQPMYYI
ncbi:MAG: Rrf2 family transcriptional regulator [Chloroflexota bacterium]|nr:MAG: Rrf2 family transcriptional regulator [Chloroflexota bacterium]